jgi:hypothetical protein
MSIVEEGTELFTLSVIRMKADGRRWAHTVQKVVAEDAATPKDHVLKLLNEAWTAVDQLKPVPEELVLGGEKK